MGGCCSSSRKTQFHRTPASYYYPPISEESESLTSHDGVATLHSRGLLIGSNLNMSIPDTYRCPPLPLPYDVVLGRAQSTNVEFREVSRSAHEKPGCIGLKETNYAIHSDSLPPSPRKLQLLKSDALTIVSTDEDDACPICFEGYDLENPKMMTRCSHHFHLSCLLEWKERCNRCPMCDQEMLHGQA